MNELRQTGVNLWAALTMYYKPWAVEAFKEQGFPFNTTTYYERLHRGHAEIAILMAVKQKTLDVEPQPD